MLANGTSRGILPPSNCIVIQQSGPRLRAGRESTALIHLPSRLPSRLPPRTSSRSPFLNVRSKAFAIRSCSSSLAARPSGMPISVALRRARLILIRRKKKSGRAG